MELEEEGAGGIQDLGAGHVPRLHGMVAEIIPVAGLGQEAGVGAGAGGRGITALKILPRGGEVGGERMGGGEEAEVRHEAGDAAAGAGGGTVVRGGQDSLCRLIREAAIGPAEERVQAPEEELHIAKEGLAGGEKGVAGNGEFQAVELGEVHDLEAQRGKRKAQGTQPAAPAAAGPEHGELKGGGAREVGEKAVAMLGLPRRQKLGGDGHGQSAECGIRIAEWLSADG